MIRSPLMPWLVALALSTTAAAQAACPSTPTANRFSYSANGAEVTDSKTGLVWARCSVGQSWSGSACTGTASTHTHEQALQLAQAASGWRLPNVKELSSIADKGCQSPAIDSAAFPATPGNKYWSSSPYVGDASDAWFVEFDLGYVYSIYHASPHSVRLVRASQ